MKLELLIAMSIGDGFVEKLNKSSKSSLIIRHSSHQKDYIEWKYSLDKNYWRYTPRHYDNCIGLKKYHGFRIVSKPNLELGELRTKLYPNDKKYISREIIENLDELGLAIWYMDDGCIDRPVGRNSMGILNTYCSSPKAEEEIIIQTYLKDKWNLKTNINSGHGRFRLRFPHIEFCKFVEIIKPYIIPSMIYKIDTTMRLSTPNLCIQQSEDTV
jgi:hypothetical protein